MEPRPDGFVHELCDLKHKEFDKNNFLLFHFSVKLPHISFFTPYKCKSSKFNNIRVYPSEKTRKNLETITNSHTLFKLTFISNRCRLQNSYLCVKTPFDKHCNFSHSKIELLLSCSDCYTLELSLLALKAAITNEKRPLNACLMGVYTRWGKGLSRSRIKGLVNLGDKLVFTI